MSSKKKHSNQTRDKIQQNIISILHAHSKGRSAKEIAGDLDIPENERNRLHNLLNSMTDKGLIRRAAGKKFEVIAKGREITGVFIRKGSGSGEVVQPDSPQKASLSRRQAANLVSGDLVTVQLRYVARGNAVVPSRLTKLVQRRKEPVVGYFESKGSRMIVTPLDPRTAPPIVIHNVSDRRKLEGKVVAVRLTQKVRPDQPVSGSVWRVLGGRSEFGVDTSILIYKHGLRDQHPNSVEQSAESIQFPDNIESNEHRKDLRDLLTITVDPENARDFDDALSLTATDSGCILGVHIADVAHYVERGSPVDREAYRRGTSVYLPERAIHMLPNHLATDVCSLKPNTDRLAVSVMMHLDTRGVMTHSEFFQSIIHSNARLAYSDYLAATTDTPPERLSRDVVTLCRSLADLCGLLLDRRVERGVLDLEMPETEFELDAHNNIIGIHKKSRSIAEQSIEEFMIAANVAVAEFLDKKDIPYLHRTHDAPDLTDMEELKSEIRKLGVDPPANPLDPSQVREMLARVSSRAVRSVLSYKVLRAMKRAVYDSRERGHFGLALETYTQFTSPIRRYPDLVVHRSLKHAMNVPGYSALSENKLQAMAQWLSDRERSAQEAEWDAAKLRKIRFMKDKIGQEFTGTITHVMEFGAFVELDEPFVEGMIPVFRIPAYINYSEVQSSLVSEDGRYLLKPGRTVAVKLVEADIDRALLDFEILTID